MGAALGHHGFYYDRLASWAGLALAVENVERFGVVSVFPVGADEVALGVAERGAGIGDAFFEYGLNGVPESFGFSHGYASGGALRMDLGEPEGLVHVDVAEARHVRLVQEPGLDAELDLFIFREEAEEQLRREAFFQGLGAELAKDLFLVLNEVETAEFPDVVVTESLPVGEGYPGALEASPLLLGVDGHKVSGHPQVRNEIIAVIQRCHDVFGAA